VADEPVSALDVSIQPQILNTDEVNLRPAHPYMKGLLDSAPVADRETEQAKVRARVTGELPSAIHPPSGGRFRTSCPLAEEICAETEPPLHAFPGTGHLAACHFPLQQVMAESAASASEAP
jgi:peptide/nickel transport system ATP-binding protein